MRNYILFFLCFLLVVANTNGQSVEDDFEGSGTISPWLGDDCNLNTTFENPYKEGINNSNTVLEYHDIGGQYANVWFGVNSEFDLTTGSTFTFKIYVPSSGLTGNQTNKVTLKLQAGTLDLPWTTQTEISKPIVLNEWQEVSFDFVNDNYFNLDPGSLPPIQRTDLDRVLIQVNGEDNTDQVIAYIDDFYYDGQLEVEEVPVFDNLVWADEFDGNGSIDDSKWFHQTQLINGDSWANGELQHYTNRTVNSYVDNGTLKIKAIKEVFTDQGSQKQYTSARLNSKFAFKYGRVDVRAKLPSVAGTWPAIWLLGKNINEDGSYWDNQGFGSQSWPFCGEIDIMEPNVPKTEILATWHWDNGAGYEFNSKSIPTNNNDTSQNFHIYSLVWTTGSMKLYMDSILINEMETVNPFNQEFFVLLNVAMGGSLGGTVDPNFDNDAMEIDYIRVYQESSLSVADEDINKIQYYPNPVSNTLNITLNKRVNSLIAFEVLDVSGRVIDQKQYKAINGKIEYNTSSLNSGLYFVNLLDQNGFKSTFKFIRK